MKWNFTWPNISPVLRISIGLLLLTISLLLIADLLGIVPNQQASKVASRKVVSESLAIQISSEIGANRIQEAVKLLNIFVKRNDTIESIALRRASKDIVMKSKNHELFWKGREDGQSTPDYIQVPIHGNKGRWGTLEVSFVPVGSFWTNIFSNRSFSAMILFVFVFGSIGYWLFLRRALSELDPSSVVPDRVRSALDVLNEGLAIIDKNERVVLINDALKKKFGISESELLGKRLSSLGWFREENDTLVAKESLPWNRILRTQQTQEIDTMQLKTENQETLTVEINVSPITAPNEEMKGVIITIDDVTALEKKNNELTHVLERLEKSQKEISRQNAALTELATRDSLTHLLNRRALFASLDILLLEAKEQKSPLSCIILDIDFFKLVNDKYGHTIGDRVLQSFAKILLSHAGNNNLVCRYGGEEFVIILPHTGSVKAMQIADSIRMAISDFNFEELVVGLNITSSFGVSVIDENYSWNAEKFIDKADQALYIAKNSGRNQVIQYSEKGNQISSGEEEYLKTENEAIDFKSKVRSKIKPDNNIEIHETSKYTIVLDRLTQAQKLAKRNKENFVILSIFVDTIQTTNNVLGHAIASKLKKIAFERLTNTFRDSDLVLPSATFEGDMNLSHLSDSEFVAILSVVENNSDITWIISRMIKELAIPVEVDGHEIVMTSNIGISSYPLDGDNADVLLSNAKMALLKARKKGRGEIVFYNQDMNILAKQALKTESQLHLALERKELYLNFQPIIDLKTGAIEKVEALLRWRHPELGLVSTEVFVDIAEHTGIIKDIGRWVIKQSCRQLNIWHKHGYSNLKISINLSAVQFYQKDLVEDILTIVQNEGVSPKSIVFELTETALLKRYDYITEAIYALHRVGFSIALDDFGTGYSSLTYLQKFPIDTIKIDRSLLIDFPKNTHSVSIISGLIGLAHNIGIDVVCEGVEDIAQLAMLSRLQCDAVQGYLISRPIATEDMTVFLGTSVSRSIVRKANISANVKIDNSGATFLEDILNTPSSLS